LPNRASVTPHFLHKNSVERLTQRLKTLRLQASDSGSNIVVVGTTPILGNAGQILSQKRVVSEART
jgi:hypothetical protein